MWASLLRSRMCRRPPALPLWSVDLDARPFLHTPCVLICVTSLPLFLSLNLRSTLPLWNCLCDIPALWSSNNSSGSFSYRRLPPLSVTIRKLQRAYKFHQRMTKNNPFHERLLRHGRPSLVVCTVCWLPLLSSWGLESWLWPEMVKLNVRLGPVSKIGHKYYGLPRYFNLEFIILYKTNISYATMYTL